MSLKYCPIEWEVTIIKTDWTRYYTDVVYLLNIKGPYNIEYEIIHLENLGFSGKNHISYYLTEKETGLVSKTLNILNYFLRELNYQRENNISDNEIIKAIEQTFSSVMVYEFNLGCSLKIEGFENDN